MVIPSGYSAVLNATAPLFGMLAAALSGEENLTPKRLLGCAVGFAGVGMLVQLGPVAVTPSVVMSALACVVASASYGFGVILMKRATVAYSPLPASAVVHIAGALVLLAPGGYRCASGTFHDRRLVCCDRAWHAYIGFYVLDQYAADARDSGERHHVGGFHDSAVWDQLRRSFFGRTSHCQHVAGLCAGSGSDFANYRLYPFKSAPPEP